jgi:flagellar protein FliO/FliZ
MNSVATTPENLQGLALLGKTALAFAIVVGSIFLCAWLARRINPTRQKPGQHLRVVASAGLGQREKVVIVQVQDRWLVLGVTPQHISPLSDMPAPEQDEPSPTISLSAPFAERLALALKQRLPARAKGDDTSAGQP